ncbi:MAG: acyl-CoA dehydrogenase family protein [Myxococcales bacterium]|nr:acyl-CoA dehydrogenase family protein [Myxococcales bacterium]
MAFYQDPPALQNQFVADALLQEHLARTLPAPLLSQAHESLHDLGERSGGPLYRMQLADRLNEPRLTQWDPWGQRIDHIEVSPLWQEAARLAARFGIVAGAYEEAPGEHARTLQFAHAYLFHPSTDVYSCPLAMTDGAARTLIELGNQPLIDRAVPFLTSRDPDAMWTSGQWMTERTGGSDVGLSETVAKKDEHQGAGVFRLYGTKWFTSATTAQMALTLARPEGNGPGGRGLALFYVEVKRPDGGYNGITVNRLKDKLGTRKVPTAELTLDGTLAVPVCGLGDGVRNISTMLNITRTWNAAMSASSMRRSIALVQDYARRRVAFGAAILDKPLHQETLASIVAEAEAGFLLAFRVVALLGRVERRLATVEEQQLFRVLTPLAKLTTGKQAVAVASEALEACGGAGYVEDTGLPLLLRDAQVLPIWEGTTNVLSLDVLRAAQGRDVFALIQSECQRQLQATSDPSLRVACAVVEKALKDTADWLGQVATQPHALEAGARGLSLTLGRVLCLTQLLSHAQWCLDHARGGRAAAVARRFASHGVCRLSDPADLTSSDRRVILGLSSDGKSA